MTLQNKPSEPMPHAFSKRPNAGPPPVSVIIPTHNRAAFVTEAIDSVLSQQYAPVELIVVDDGSTDHTAETLAAYENRIQVIRQANKGVSAARNRGIQAATGDYIAFLDSDDLWLPEKLVRQTAFFSANPDALICQTEEIWIRNGKRVNPRKKHKKPSGFIFRDSLALCLVSPSAVMLKRHLIDEIGGFDESLPACEDYDLWLRISHRFPIHLIDEALIVKRGGHADQLSKMIGLDRYRIQSLCKLLDRAVLDPGDYTAAADMLETKCRIYANGCLKRNKPEEAAMYFDLMKQYRRRSWDA